MTLEQLKIFLEAARYGSFTLAAQRLGITQSAVSSCIRKLETELELPLFERQGRRVVGTEAGQILLGEAERIIGDVDLMIRRVESFRDSGRTRMIIACTRNAYDHWMPRILSQMDDTTEFDNIDIISGTRHEVSAWVMRGTADAGVSESTPGHAEFSYFSVFEDAMLLCATQDCASTLDLPPDGTASNYDVPAVWESGTDLESFANNVLNPLSDERQSAVPSGLTLHSTAAVLSVIESGRFPGVVPQRAAQRLIENGKLIRLTRTAVPISYWMFSLKHKGIEKFAAQVAHTAQEIDAGA
ncbi:MAG: LysR family transcriptional regulator [Alphaproteobacteria bacterium]